MRYSFVPELNDCAARQISLEAAQPDLDLSILRSFPTRRSSSASSTSLTCSVETPEVVAARIRRALAHVAPERLVVAPDCGTKYLSRRVALAKLRAMVRGAEIVRDELGPA
jgi:5-methyltetrahydropteroyltriglutamate--homocysteine methyltransferase